MSELSFGGVVSPFWVVIMRFDCCCGRLRARFECSGVVRLGNVDIEVVVAILKVQ